MILLLASLAPVPVAVADDCWNTEPCSAVWDLCLSSYANFGVRDSKGILWFKVPATGTVARREEQHRCRRQERRWADMVCASNIGHNLRQLADKILGKLSSNGSSGYQGIVALLDPLWQKNDPVAELQVDCQQALQTFNKISTLV